jgi:hypothetical protein
MLVLLDRLLVSSLARTVATAFYRPHPGEPRKCPFIGLTRKAPATSESPKTKYNTTSHITPRVANNNRARHHLERYRHLAPL